MDKHQEYGRDYIPPLPVSGDPVEDSKLMADDGRWNNILGKIEGESTVSGMWGVNGRFFPAVHQQTQHGVYSVGRRHW